MNPPPILTVSHLTVALSGRRVLNDLSFEVPSGARFAIVGPNGSGKTVLLRTLMDLLPHTGSVVWKPGVHIGYVPQELNADPRLPLSGSDLLRAKAHLLGLGTAEVDATASAVGLNTQTLKNGIGLLSGGQLQKVLIAFALLGKSTVLLVDEPTASLDELAESRVYELLDELQRTRSLTVLMVSHDLTMVLSHADLVLSLGGITWRVGAPQTSLTPEALSAQYSLPSQYFKRLFDIHSGPQRPSRDISE